MPLVDVSDDSLWYKDAIIYEIPVFAFSDANGDGIGDFRGLIYKLDYLKQLGITAIWLLPFFSSPLKDGGYDITDHKNINQIYGTLDDFKDFLKAAHNIGIRVIIDLVLNHTSDQHPWFQSAKQSPRGSKARDFYVWSDNPNKFSEARVVFQDFESSNWTWDSDAKMYYWHRFYSHQPDLNLDDQEVQRELFEIVDFWFGLGVDGMRLDAIPFLFEREGTNCVNLQETHSFLKKLRTHLDHKFSHRMLLAEVNERLEDVVPYFGQGDECHMAFYFPIITQLFLALCQEDVAPIIDILNQTHPLPDLCQWAIYLRNHDHLSLEMVTKEECDLMYSVYAKESEARLHLGIKRRLAPLLGNDRRQIELMNMLLMSLPGAPVIYYGDEIGMGDNINLSDRDGLRTPMQWSSDKNAGFSQATSQDLYQPVIDDEYGYTKINVAEQTGNPISLFSWMKNVIAKRKQFRAFSRGQFELISSDNKRVLAFTRVFEDEHLLVVANMSNGSQSVKLDLRRFLNMTPVGILDQAKLPIINDYLYQLSLNCYQAYWFSLLHD